MKKKESELKKEVVSWGKKILNMTALNVNEGDKIGFLIEFFPYSLPLFLAFSFSFSFLFSLFHFLEYFLQILNWYSLHHSSQCQLSTFVFPFSESPFLVLKVLFEFFLFILRAPNKYSSFFHKRILSSFQEDYSSNSSFPLFHFLCIPCFELFLHFRGKRVRKKKKERGRKQFCSEQE